MALRALPFTAKHLWVNSYQSWVWNRVAAHRLGMVVPLQVVSPQRQEQEQEDEEAGTCMWEGDLCCASEGCQGGEDVASVRMAASSVRFYSTSQPSTTDYTDYKQQLPPLLAKNVVLPLFGKSVLKYPENDAGK
jgi:tRNA(Glu) U13 pseudouridine synthase TruD